MQKKLFQKTLSICLALSIMIGLLPQIPVLAAEDTLKICVISDTHYYPLTYVSDCEDYQTYVNGDPKMLAESDSVLDSAVEMIEKDQPDIVLVSGDLTKDGEIEGHRDLAAKFQALEDETDTEVFVINGVGTYLITAINNRNYPVVQSTVLVIATIFIIINLIVDILYCVIDPRISYE